MPLCVGGVVQVNAAADSATMDRWVYGDSRGRHIVDNRRDRNDSDDGRRS